MRGRKWPRGNVSEHTLSRVMRPSVIGKVGGRGAGNSRGGVDMGNARLGVTYTYTPYWGPI